MGNRDEHLALEDAPGSATTIGENEGSEVGDETGSYAGLDQSEIEDNDVYVSAETTGLDEEGHVLIWVGPDEPMSIGQYFGNGHADRIVSAHLLHDSS